MNAKIIGMGSYLPERVLTNEDLSQMVETNDEWITTRTGISERRVTDGEAAWELALKASQKALKQAGITADQLDMVVVTSVTPDYYFPAMSCLVCNRLGAKNAFAFDVSVACPGFVYALDLGRSYIQLGRCKYVLAVATECLSRITDYTDRRTCVLFGDGAGAAVLAPCGENEGILDSRLLCDPDGAEKMFCRAVKAETPFTEPGKIKLLGDPGMDKEYLTMDGQDVFRFAVGALPDLVSGLLSRKGLTTSDLDWLIPHQANLRIIRSAIKKLDLSEEKVGLTMNLYGNTGCASVPICLDELLREGKIEKGNLLALAAFGAGYTAGGCLIRW